MTVLTINVDKIGTALNPITNKVVPVYSYTMINANKLSVTIIDHGATVTSIKYPDKYDKIKDVCLGLTNLEDQVRHKNLYMGCTLGRVANRVSKGEFDIDGNTVKLTKNFQDKYQINGGFNGFDAMVWQVVKYRNDGIVMRHINPDCHEGYPGKLNVTITFTLDDCNRFKVFIETMSNKITPVNVANHIYLNLAGHETRKEGLGQHNIILKADKIVEINNEMLPTGCLMPVKHTPYDLRKYTNLGRRLDKFVNMPINGYDHTYCLDSIPDKKRCVAKIIHPCSGRYLEIFTDRPGLHLETANNFPDIDKGDNPLKGKDNAIYVKHGAFCLMPQQYPDSMNNLNFPTVMTAPKQKYCFETIYKFGTFK